MEKVAYRDILRLEEIKDEIKDLVHEAKGLIPSGTITYERARSYWIAHILCALDNDNDYLGGSMFTMQDTINELPELNEGEDEETDQEQLDRIG